MNPRPQPVTIAPITIAPVTMAPVPPCARLAAICAAIDGREVTCPAAARRTCATLAALRRIAPLAGERAPRPEIAA